MRILLVVPPSDSGDLAVLSVYLHMQLQIACGS